MKSLPKLANLTPDHRVWRLDWFGDCGYPPHIRRYAQPSIKVVLSAVRSDPPDHSALLDPASTDHQHSHAAWAPISALPLLAIGDLWQDGRQITSPDYQIETFKSLTITPETTSFVKAGLAINEHFLLPLNYHPWHRTHTHAYCVAVELGQGKRLLVPCVELIRFYFGSSGNLIQRLFTQPLAASSLWSEKRFDTTTRHLHLVLAEKLSGASASDIGRIANSKFAWRAAASIFASCQKAAVQRHPVYPYTGFPFEGITDLVASGVWLPFGEQETATFLVYRLRSCSYPFPFRSLSYEAADKKIQSSRSDKEDEQKKVFARQPGEIDKTTDADPAANKRLRSVPFTGKHRFPDLAGKQVWREKIQALGGVDVFLKRDDGTLEQVAFGESSDNSKVGGIDVAVADEENHPKARLPWFVHEGIRILRKRPEYADTEITVSVVCPLDRKNPVFNLPMVVNEDGEIDQTLLVEVSSGKTRSRQGCFVEAVQGERRLNFLVIEGNTSRQVPMIVPIGSQRLLSLNAECRRILNAALQVSSD